MANPLFEQKNEGPAKNGGIFGMMFNRMYQNNPEFRDFANSMQGLSEQEMISKCGADPNAVEQAKKNPADFFARKGLL